jgi:hypothetical protein
MQYVTAVRGRTARLCASGLRKPLVTWWCRLVARDFRDVNRHAGISEDEHSGSARVSRRRRGGSGRTDHGQRGASTLINARRPSWITSTGAEPKSACWAAKPCAVAIMVLATWSAGMSARITPAS